MEVCGFYSRRGRVGMGVAPIPQGGGIRFRAACSYSALWNLAAPDVCVAAS